MKFEHQSDIYLPTRRSLHFAWDLKLDFYICIATLAHPMDFTDLPIQYRVLLLKVKAVTHKHYDRDLLKFMNFLEEHNRLDFSGPVELDY